MGTRGQQDTEGGGQGVGRRGGGGVFRAEGTYTWHRYHALPQETNSRALSFRASHPRRPPNVPLAGDRTGWRGATGSGG